MAYSALLFDLDDTLLDFAAAEDIALKQLHANFFVPHAEEKHMKTLFHKINRALWHLVSMQKKKPQDVSEERFVQLLEALRAPLDPKELALHYEKALSEQLVWFEGAQEAVKKLAQKHKIGVITNGLRSVQERKYENGTMHEWCSCFIISEKVGISKPHPKIFQMAFEELEISPHETLMIGDSLESDFQGAINCNIDFCWINRKNLDLPKHFPPPKITLQSVMHLPSCLS